MEPLVLRTLAETLFGLGAIGLLAAAVNLLALRGITIEDVPGCVRARVRWWGTHTPAVLFVSGTLTLVSLAALFAVDAR
jgi:hypothetical protein